MTIQIDKGKIEVEGKISYQIKQIIAEFGEDLPHVIGVLRCTRIAIKSDAPSEINLKAETVLYNELADVPYNDASGNGSYRNEARKDISKRVGIDISQITIE